MERALLDRDFRKAIGLYQNAFGDAGYAEARTFVLQEFDKLRRQKPRELAAAAPSIWDLDWRLMAVCGLLEILVVAAYWWIFQPASALGIAIGWWLGVALAIAFFAMVRLVSFGKRILATLPFAASLISFATLTYRSGWGDGFGRSLFFGVFIGAALVTSGAIRRHRRRPRTA